MENTPPVVANIDGKTIVVWGRHILKEAAAHGKPKMNMYILENCDHQSISELRERFLKLFGPDGPV